MTPSAQAGSPDGPEQPRPAPGAGGSRSRNRRRRRPSGQGGGRPPQSGSPRGGNRGRGPNGSGGPTRSRPDRPRERTGPRQEPPAPAPTSPPLTSGGLSIAEAEVHQNRRRARLLCLVGGLLPALVLGVILGVVAGPVVGVVVAVAVVAAVAVALWRWATNFALARIGGRPLDEDEEPRLTNLVDGLCATFGVPRPALRLVEDPVPNACSLGRTPSDAVLVVTSGLLDRLGLIEMEGVVAHELAHIKRGDTALAGVAVGLLAPWIALGGSDRLFQRVVGTGREYRADQVAVSTVRYPPGLRDALLTLEQGPEAAPGSLFCGRRFAMTRWLWIDPMVGGRGDGAVGELDATRVRVAALAEW